MKIKHKSQSWLDLLAGLSSGGCLVKRAVAQSGSSCGWSSPVQPSAAWFCSHQQRFTRRLSSLWLWGWEGIFSIRSVQFGPVHLLNFCHKNKFGANTFAKKKKSHRLLLFFVAPRCCLPRVLHNCFSPHMHVKHIVKGYTCTYTCLIMGNLWLGPLSQS